MSDGFNDESFYNPNPTMHQQNQQAFGFDNDHRHAEIQYGDQFLDFLDAIKTQNYANFSQLLRSNPQFAKRIDVTSRQPPLFYVVQLANQDMALQMIQDLIAQGAEPTYKDPLSQNVMSYVARDGRMKVFDYLVSIGVSPNEIDIYKQTPLFYACREGRLELCKKILDLGANPNHVDMNGQTCLFYSAKMGHLDICKLLVDYGIKHDHVDFKKQTALAWARKSKNQALVDYLQSLKGGHRAPKPEAKPAQKKKGPKAKEEPKNQYKIVFVHNNGAQEDLTEDAFETFKANFPTLADYFMHPEKIPHEETHGNNKEKWQKAAKKIHTSLWKVKGSFIFHEPVDPVKLNCFDYFQIIKNPMDFGTIKTRLNSGYYKKLQEYIDDVNLVFRNCYLYNGTGSEVGKTGVMVDKEFQRLCKENNVEQLLIEEARSENKSEQADHESMLSFPHELMDEEFTGDMFNLDETGS